MESSEIIRASSSLRRNTCTWRSNGNDAFSRSTGDEDDEEALKWAALEKLPTYDRLRKGILMSVSRNAAAEIDVDDLGYHERKNLIERLVKVAEDNEKLLQKLKNRIDRY